MFLKDFYSSYPSNFSRIQPVISLRTFSSIALTSIPQNYSRNSLVCLKQFLDNILRLFLRILFSFFKEVCRKAQIDGWNLFMIFLPIILKVLYNEDHVTIPTVVSPGNFLKYYRIFFLEFIQEIIPEHLKKLITKSCRFF